MAIQPEPYARMPAHPRAYGRVGHTAHSCPRCRCAATKPFCWQLRILCARRQRNSGSTGGRHRVDRARSGQQVSNFGAVAAALPAAAACRDHHPARRRSGQLPGITALAPGGAANAARVFSWVRTFYQDLARWAADEPTRWGPWVAPCPVRDSDTDHSKNRARRKAAMDQRTRTLLPALPALVKAVERQHKGAQTCLATGRETPAGAPFTTPAGENLLRRAGVSSRVYADDPATGRCRDLTVEEERAFWAWAIVEVLRHTGMRIEEALELTHHSFVAYQLPTTGEIVPMLQVAPSKLDQERLLLVSPELGEVLTAIIHRVRRGQRAMPLVSAYDSLERLWSAPMPFLFQRRCGPEDRATPRNYIYTCLNDALAASGLTGPGDEQLRYTPHDFRRIFVTDALRSGLPPHIAARICGHRMVDTTLGYAAIYPEDVINHHRSFIARRRSLRPSEEYREPTAQEWQDFLAHFELRKVALGVCARDFGTPCVHEHACIRCPVLRPDPEQMPRLEEIHANLIDRLQEAKEQGARRGRRDRGQPRRRRAETHRHARPRGQAHHRSPRHARLPQQCRTS